MPAFSFTELAKVQILSMMYLAPTNIATTLSLHLRLKEHHRRGSKHGLCRLVQGHGEWVPYSKWGIGTYLEQNKNVNYIQVIRTAGSGDEL